MIDLPKFVDVGTATYKVIVTDRMPRLDGKALFGLCCSGAKKIWVRKSLPDDEKLSTFWHEVLHALDFEWGVGSLTHEAIYELEKPLACFIQDNPELYKLWLSNEG